MLFSRLLTNDSIFYYLSNYFLIVIPNFNCILTFLLFVHRFSILAYDLKRVTSLGDAFHCIDRQLDSHGVVRNEYVWKALSFFTKEKTISFSPNSDQAVAYSLRLLHCCSPLEFNESPARRVEQAQTVWNVITNSNKVMPQRLNLFNALLQSYVSNSHLFDPVEYLGLVQKAGLVPDQVSLFHCTMDLPLM